MSNTLGCFGRGVRLARSGNCCISKRRRRFLHTGTGSPTKHTLVTWLILALDASMALTMAAAAERAGFQIWTRSVFL
tara:strand:+ start:502 stop:732 length:231 start_codon:yes stop_codon:yes gene_type:complete